MVNKLCCTCGQVKPLKKFPKKIVGNRREAECEDCIKNHPLVRERPKILGKSTIPPRLGRMHETSEVLVIEDTPVQTSENRQSPENTRAIQVWEKRLMRFAINRDWFTPKDAKEPAQYSLPIVRNILNTLVTFDYLEKNDEKRVKLYRIKQNHLLKQDAAGLIAE